MSGSRILVVVVASGISLADAVDIGEAVNSQSSCRPKLPQL